jgi:glucose-1-phosphate thymidylyltransferase
MIYYPLSVLMLAGIREVLIVSNAEDMPTYKKLLGNGNNLGIEICYVVQQEPKGIPEAYLLGEDFLQGEGSFLILGDNVFVGSGLGRNLQSLKSTTGAHVFLYQVENPTDYGNVSFDKKGEISGIYEKPEQAKSRFVIPGLYICDSTASERAKKLQPSSRGELEVIDLLRSYLNANELSFTELSRGTVWLDTGSPSNLYTASDYVRVIQERQGIQIACLEEIALQNKWISSDQLSRLESFSYKSLYGQYVRGLIE